MFNVLRLIETLLRRIEMDSLNYEQYYKNTVIDFFDGRTTYDNEHTIKRALPLLSLASLKPGQQVLDIATGTGIIAIASSQLVGSTGKVVGVDFSAGMLNQAQQKIKELGTGKTC